MSARQSLNRRTAGRPETAAALCALAGQFFATEGVPADRSFQDLGGSSLDALRFASRVRDALKMDVPLEELLGGATFATLAASLQPIEETAVSGEPETLSHGQRGLWLLHSLRRDESTFNVFDLQHINGELDSFRLLEAVNTTLASHEILREQLVIRNGLPVPEPGLRPQCSLNETFARLPDVARHAKAIAQTPIQLDVEPLIKAILYKVSPTQHALLLVAHHIVLDDWSIGLLHASISEAYAGGFAGKDVSQRKLAAVEAAWLNGNQARLQRAFWRHRLQGAPAQLPHPFAGNPEATSAQPAAGHVRREIAEDTQHRLEQLANTFRSSSFTLLMATYGAWLSEITGRQNLVFGTPVSGRCSLDAERSVGHFVNLLPIRTQLRPGLRFADLVQSLHREFVSALENQRLPFTEVVRAVKPRRSANTHPLFQTVFAYQNARRAGGELKLGDAETGRIALDSSSPQFPLTLFVENPESAPSLHLEYDRRLIADDDAERWLDLYVRLLAQFLNAPDAVLFEVDQPHDKPGAQSTNLKDLFEQQVRRTPGANAILDGDVPMTYQELNAQANIIAYALKQQGLATGETVAVPLARSRQAIAAIVGILKAGGAYVPIDPSYPDTRIRYMMESADCRRAIIDGESAPFFADAGTECVDLRMLDWRRQCEDPEGTPPADQLANVIYTSGSTGQPKAVAVPHRAIARLVVGADYFDFTAHTVFLHAAPLTFDASTLEVWGPLLNGGACAILRKTAADVGALKSTIRKQRVNAAWLTSSLFNFIVDEAIDTLAGVATVLVGGEALSPAHIAKAQTHFPGLQLINGYGPTEGTTFTCCFAIPDNFSSTETHVPIGQAIHGTSVTIVDEWNRPICDDKPGELVIGGAGVALGYLNRPGDDAFIRDSDDELLYRTGDLVRRGADGNLVFLGRLDRQLKIRGHRIEPGEVEAALQQEAAIDRAYVDAFVSSTGDKQLIAFVTPAMSPPQVDGLRARLQSLLPAYAVPQRTLSLDILPLTANGKVDRARLERLLADESTMENPVAALSANQTKLMSIWQSLLPDADPGLDDDFFALGGDSLLLARLASAVEHHYGIELPLSAFFESPTVREMAERLDHRGADTAESLLIPIKPSGDRPALFIVHPLGGSVVGFVDFARFLPPEQPLYGLQAAESVPLDAQPQSIEAMAALYLEHVRQMQPKGPYYLGGVSMGGAIALEMALQLQRLGEETAYLLIGDTWFDKGPHVQPLKSVAAKLLTWMWDVPRRLPRLLADSEERRADSRRSTPSSGTRKQPLDPVHENAFHRYTPDVFDGAVTLVRSRNLSTSQLYFQRCHGPSMGWQALATKAVTVYEVPGTHRQLCYEDNAKRFAEIIEESITLSTDARWLPKLTQAGTGSPGGSES